MKSIFKKDRFRHLKFCPKKNIISFISISILCSSTSFGQSKIDSLTTEINKTNSLAQKAPLYLKRALLYTKNESKKAFNDVDKAITYFIKESIEEGQVDSYIAYGNLHSNYGEPLRAAHFDSLAIALAEKIAYEKGKSIAIGNLGREYKNSGSLEQAEFLIKKAIHLEENFRPIDKKRLVVLYNQYSIICFKQGNLTKSLIWIEKAIKLIENTNDIKELSRIYINYANTLSRLSKFDEAVKVHYKVIRLCEKTNDTIGLMRSYNNLGIAFRNGGEFDKAISYYKKSIAIGKQVNDYKLLGLSLVNLATVYSEKGQFDAMDTLYQQGIQYFEKIPDLGGIAFANHNYGNFLTHQEKYPEADSHLLKAKQLRLQIGAMRDYASTLAVLGRSSLRQQKWKAAENYLIEAETVATQLSNGDRSLKELYAYFKELYTKTGNYKKAYQYQSKELELEKTLFTESEKVNTLKAEAAYEMEKQDIEMALEREKQQRNKQLMLFISAGVVGLLLFTLLIFWLRRRQLKERHKASIQNLTNEHRLKVSKALKTAEQQERKKIAHKLHDESGSMLSIAILNVNQLQDDIFKAGGSSEEKLETTKKLLKDISDSVRNISHTLMPVVLEKHGIKPAIQELVNSINTSKKIKIEEIIEGLEDTHSWSEEFCLTIYRIVQEVVNNIIKHAQATHVLLQVVELEDSVTIYIEDNGKGIDESNSTDGIGLKTLKNNVAYLNGTIEINGNLNKGTFILAELPIEKTKNVKLPLP